MHLPVMKKLLSLFLIFTVSGCSLMETDQDDVNGKWEWVYSYGGIAGQTLSPETEGHRQQLIFYGGRYYILARDGETLRKGLYYYSEPKIGGRKRSAIEFESDNWKTFYEISNDTLFLSPNCRDCFFDTYVRKQ
jgi:hypothetical protein